MSAHLSFCRARLSQLAARQRGVLATTRTNRRATGRGQRIDLFAGGLTLPTPGRFASGYAAEGDIRRGRGRAALTQYLGDRPRTTMSIVDLITALGHWRVLSPRVVEDAGW